LGVRFGLVNVGSKGWDHLTLEKCLGLGKVGSKDWDTLNLGARVMTC